VGKVRDDQLGAIFAHDLRAQGAVYETRMAPPSAKAETGRCIVIVTPDGERSMNTYLGVTEHLTPADIDTDQIAASEWIYLEGYRFDGPESHEAFAVAIDAAKKAGGRVALTLSDPFCVERHRDAFRRMITDSVDLLFANRAEIMSMYHTDDFKAALAAGADDVEILACTESEKGAHVLSAGKHWHVPAVPTRIVDATGAGDLFAGAFLWGLTQGRDLETCARMGNLAASEVISHIGARPEADLKALFRKNGLID
jgi:sugar/nucleoside kinase (ribokinase family)